MQTKADYQVYAGFFVRLAAYLVDLLIIGAVLLIVRIPLWISYWTSPDNFVLKDFIFQYSLADIVLYLLKVLYFVVLTYKTGSTLGKKLFHLRVVNAEEKRLTLFQVIYRETIGRYLSAIILNIGYILIAIDKKKCGIHDLLADTYVVYYHEKKVYQHTEMVYRNMMNQSTQSMPARSQMPLEAEVPNQEQGTPMMESDVLSKPSREVVNSEISSSINSQPGKEKIGSEYNS